jgi:hypothetical protein
MYGLVQMAPASALGANPPVTRAMLDRRRDHSRVDKGDMTSAEPWLEDAFPHRPDR